MGMPWLPFKSSAIDRLFTHRFDVLHVIEAWDPSDQKTIIDRARSHGYHHHHLPRVNNGPNGCDFNDPTVAQYAQFFVGCLVTQTLPGPINTQDVVQPYPYPMNRTCAEVAVGLSLASATGQLCLSCLINAMQTLPNGPAALGSLEICGTQQGKKYFNGGQNGQIILSRHPIRDVKETHLEAFLSNRVNIYATINNIKIGFGHWAYNVLADYGPFGDYMYGATQMDHANDMLAQNADVLIGDFNTGLDYQKEGYEHLLQNGYVDLIQKQPRETWCPPSHKHFLPCILSAGDIYPASIDHVMLKKNCNLWGENARLFNQALLSDHVGVAATVRKLWFTNPNSTIARKFRC